MSYPRDLAEYDTEELKKELERRSLKKGPTLPAGLRIFALDAAWWLLLPVAWPAWAVCCVYSEIGSRRLIAEAQKS